MPKMPVLFIGHGSPMNAIETNAYTRTLGSLAERIEKPKAILVVSAHWLTKGTFVTAMENPRTIHDFGGFPKELFDVQYPAPGSPAFASLVTETVKSPSVGADVGWGLDHGTWSVLRHLYPDATIPVLQLSIDYARPGEYHLRVGEELRKLRDQGVLIVGSGNIVHNLRRISWETDAPPMDWAVEFDAWAKEKLLSRDTHALASGYLGTEAGKLAVPTPDHYFPLLYALGAAEKTDELRFEFEEIQNGSIAMRSFSLA